MKIKKMENVVDYKEYRDNYSVKEFVKDEKLMRLKPEDFKFDELFKSYTGFGVLETKVSQVFELFCEEIILLYYEELKRRSEA